jgi:hypothetical protein
LEWRRGGGIELAGCDSEVALNLNTTVTKRLHFVVKGVLKWVHSMFYPYCDDDDDDDDDDGDGDDDDDDDDDDDGVKWFVILLGGGHMTRYFGARD